MFYNLGCSADFDPTRPPGVNRLQVIYYKRNSRISVLDVLVPSSLEED